MRPAASCSHCGLPVGRIGRHQEVHGESHWFCCYGCCLAFQFHHGASEEPEAAAWLVRLGVGAFLAMNIMLFSLLLYADAFSGADAWLREPVHWLLWALTTPLLVLLGGPFFDASWRALRAGRLVTDTLVAIGVLAAYGYSVWQLLRGSSLVYFDTATMVLMLFTLGRYVEAQGRARAARSLAPMLAAERAQVRVVRDGIEALRPIGAVQAADLVRVLPGERVAVDGVVVEGRSECDESVLTGQPDARPKAPGADVFAGSLNGNGLLLVRATAPGLQTRWVQIGRMVREALASKTLVGESVDRVAAVFIPGVLLLALATAWFWYGHGGADGALLAGLAVLVVACPCSLGLAAPLASALAIGQAAQRGILIRSGGVLERLARLRGIAFDKTGTLTHDDLRFAGLQLDGASHGEVLRRARMLAAGSDHPIARAVLVISDAPALAPAAEMAVGAALTSAAETADRALLTGAAEIADRGALLSAANLQARAGAGISGGINGELCAIGSADFITSFGWSIAPCLNQRADDGCTSTFVGWDGAARARLSFVALPVAEAADVIAALHGRGLDTLLLSGDGAGAVEHLAIRLGISSWHARLLPDDKVTLLRAWSAAHGPIAMVGDGLNDGPVLAAAAVGIAVGGATDLARESADVVLPRGGLASVPWLLREADRVRRSVRANLRWAFGYNALALALAAGGVLQPVLAAALMAGSSLLVVARSWHAHRRANAAEERPLQAAGAAHAALPG